MLIGHRARNHPKQVARRDEAGSDDRLFEVEVADDTDLVDERRTQPDTFGQALRFAGIDDVDLDVAANGANSLARRWYDRADDGLAQPWTGRVWCNPPYSDISSWVRKAWDEWAIGEVEVIVMLLPANRTEQAWWQDHIEPHRDHDSLHTRFLRGRHRFGRPPGVPVPVNGDRPPFGLVVVVWR